MACAKIICARNLNSRENFMNILMFYLRLYTFYGTKCASKGTTKELDHWRSKNKELLELALELGSL